MCMNLFFKFKPRNALHFLLKYLFLVNSLLVSQRPLHKALLRLLHLRFFLISSTSFHISSGGTQKENSSATERKISAGCHVYVCVGLCREVRKDSGCTLVDRLTIRAGKCMVYGIAYCFENVL